MTTITEDAKSGIKSPVKPVVYDEWGVNVEYKKWIEGKTREEIKTANDHAIYWYHNVGTNPIPCISQKKNYYLMEYGDFYKKGMDKKTFNHLLEIGIFVLGIAVTTGKLWRSEHEGHYLNLIDYDNAKGKDLILRNNNNVVSTLKDFATKNIVETNKGSPDRGHVYIITERPLTPKQADGVNGVNDDDGKPRIEIYSGNHLSTAANSYKLEKFYKDGKEIENIPNYHRAIYRTEIIKTEEELNSGAFRRPPAYFDSEQTDKLEMEFNRRLEKSGVSYLNKNNKSKNNNGSGRKSETLEDLLDDNFKVHHGGNKQGYLLKFIDKLLIHLKAKNIPLSYDDLKQIVINRNNKVNVPPLKEKDAIRRLDEAIKFIDLKTGFIEGEQALIKELEELGVNVEHFMEEKALSEAAVELGKLIKSHALKHEEPIDPVIAADIIEQKYEGKLKSFDDTDEVLFFNGKVYETNGERLVMKEVERMRKEEHNVIKRLSEIGSELNKMIIRRHNAGKGTIELENYEHPLAQKLYEKQQSHMKVTDHFRREVVKHIITRTWINRNLFNTDTSVIVLDNCVLKLNFNTNGNDKDLTWTPIDHSPEILSTNLLDISYNPEAKCPKWLNFINQATGVNEKARIDLQKMFGYCLLKEIKYKKAFILLGPRDVGKSIITGVLDQLVGPENASHLTLQMICDGNQFATSALYGKLVNTCGDLPKTEISDTGMFKAITGGDPINIEPKGKTSFPYKPVAKFVFVANDIPESKDESTAFYERIKIIEIECSVSINDIDVNLKEKIINDKEEMSGIFNWTLEGLKMLIKDNAFEDTGSVLTIKHMYKENSDKVYKMMDQYYEIVKTDASKDTFYAIPTKEVHAVWIEFLKKEYKDKDISQYLNLKALDNRGSGNVKLNLNNPIVQGLAKQVLGRELKNKGIENKQLVNSETKEREHHYIELKRKYRLSEIDGKPILGLYDELVEKKKKKEEEEERKREQDQIKEKESERLNELDDLHKKNPLKSSE